MSQSHGEITSYTQKQILFFEVKGCVDLKLQQKMRRITERFVSQIADNSPWAMCIDLDEFISYLLETEHPGLKLRQWCLEKHLIAEAIILNQQSIQHSMLEHFFELGENDFSGRYFDNQKAAIAWLEQRLNE